VPRYPNRIKRRWVRIGEKNTLTVVITEVALVFVDYLENKQRNKQNQNFIQLYFSSIAFDYSIVVFYTRVCKL